MRFINTKLRYLILLLTLPLTIVSLGFFASSSLNKYSVFRVLAEDETSPIKDKTFGATEEYEKINPSECTRFVSTEGNDLNDGLTLETPFRTIAKGDANLTPGTVLCVKGGIYNEAVSITATGTSEAPIKIGEYEGGGKVQLNGTKYSLPDASCYNKDKRKDDPSTPMTEGAHPCVYAALFAVTNSNYIQVTGFKLFGSSGIGANIQQSNYILARGIDITSSYGSGINIDLSKNIELAHAHIWENKRSYPERGYVGGAGAQVILSENVNIHHLTLHENWGEGLNVGRGTKGALIYKSKFWENAHTMFYINHADDVVLDSNLLFCTGNKLAWQSQNGVKDKTPSMGTAITIRNESGINDKGFKVADNNAVINNIIVGCTNHIVTGVQKNTYLLSALIANNTFVEARGYNLKGAKKPDFINLGGDNKAYRARFLIANNVFIQSVDKPKLINGAGIKAANVSFSNNISTKSLSVSKPGITLVPDFQLANMVDLLNFTPQTISPETYELIADSLAIDGGTPITLFNFFGLGRDFYNIPRQNAPDIGAFEFVETSESTESTESTESSLF